MSVVVQTTHTWVEVAATQPDGIIGPIGDVVWNVTDEGVRERLA